MVKRTEATQTYSDLYKLRAELETELGKSAISGDYTIPQRLRLKMEAKVTELERLLDPYEVTLRDEIAKEYNYNFVGPFSKEGLARVEKRDRHFFIDREGTNIHKNTLSFAKDYRDGLSVVGVGQLSQVINTSGQFLGRPYSFIGDFSCGFAPALSFSDKSFTFINTLGNPIAKSRFFLHFAEIRPFSEGIAWVKNNPGEDWHMLDSKLELSKKTYPAPGCFSEGLSYLWQKKQIRNRFLLPTGNTEDCYTFINKNGEQVLPTNKSKHYKKISSFSEGLAWVKTDDYSGFIDPLGKLILPVNCVIAEPFSEGLSLVEFEAATKFFFMNKQNQFLKTGFADRIVLNAKSFQEGLGALETQDGWFFIDKRGKTINDRGFNKIKSHFNKGVAQVSIGPDTFYIDRLGRRIFV